MSESAVRFSIADLDLFRAASGDENPLHSSSSYAHRTPFGQRVVFGVLGALACLEQIGKRAGHGVARVELECRGAMFPGIDYAIECDAAADPAKAQATLSDGQRLLLKLIVHYRTAEESDTRERNDNLVPVGLVAKQAGSAIDDPSDDVLMDGTTIEAIYTPGSARLPELECRFNLRGVVTQTQLAAICWCSYVAGMKLPGRRALLFAVDLKFDSRSVLPSRERRFSYRATAAALDQRFRLLHTAAQLWDGRDHLADAEIKAFVREESLPGLPGKDVERSTRLKGRVALVIGASRGLGAAIAYALAAEGCTVIGSYAQSKREAEALQEAARDATGEIILEQGDAADLGWCRTTKRMLLERFSRLDFLICNACPALLPLWLDENSAERIVEHIETSTRLVSNPMAVFMDLVSNSGGGCAVLSSIAIHNPPAEWPHYVAAKCAIEGLARAAAVEYTSVGVLIVRPPRLHTDLTNTPLAIEAAASPIKVARAIVQELVQLRAGLNVLEDLG